MIGAPRTVVATLNGESVTVPVGTLLGDLLAARGIEPTRIAVERNGQVVPRAERGALCLEDGDVFEVVEFVGGG